MVTILDITRTKRELMINKQKIMKTLIQGLRVRWKEQIDLNVGLKNLQENWKEKLIIRILERN